MLSGAPAQASVTRFCQRCSARNGITGAIPRMPWTGRATALERRLVTVPEAAARAADIPVGDVDELLEALDQPVRELVLERMRSLPDVLLRPGDQPAVEGREISSSGGEARSP